MYVDILEHVELFEKRWTAWQLFLFFDRSFVDIFYLNKY